MEMKCFAMIACLVAAIATADAHADTSAGVLRRLSTRRLLQGFGVVDVIRNFAGIPGDVVTGNADSDPAATSAARTAGRDGTIVSVENNPVFDVPGSGDAENVVTVYPEIINVADGSTVIFLPFSKWPFPIATAWTEWAKRIIQGMP